MTDSKAGPIVTVCLRSAAFLAIVLAAAACDDGTAPAPPDAAAADGASAPDGGTDADAKSCPGPGDPCKSTADCRTAICACLGGGGASGSLRCTTDMKCETLASRCDDLCGLTRDAGHADGSELGSCPPW